ncbi:hypothetical protein ACFT2C_04420 [Promicromonospora sp. NPDC057138]|uniref:hypothetical protein n=1 Tax=Promicromonospora sp. NPDC057138 TaxID=3346031 RepID=UPI00363551C9
MSATVHATNAAPSIVVLGAAGRLGHILTDTLPRLGFPTLGITRTGTPQCAAAVDVTDPRWSKPASWRSVTAGWPPITAVINLVTGREPEARQAEASSRAGVEVMRAVTEAIGGEPLMVHLGSIGEASRPPLSAYVAGKIAARRAANADGRVTVLTVAIVPRAVGAKADRTLRMLCRLSPCIAAQPIPVTAGEIFAHTLASLLSDGTAAGRHMVLAACEQPLGQVLGTRNRAGTLGDHTARALIAAPTAGKMLGGRAVSLAKAALGSTVIEHYAAAIPSSSYLAASTPGQLVARHNDDELGSWWLVPADIADRRATLV